MLTALATPKTTTVEPDGDWCPMAHANHRDDSFQDLPPLRQVRHVQQITDRNVSPVASTILGSFTGSSMAVCAYEAPEYPALVAYDYVDGSVRWTSPLHHLPGLRRRWVAGLLLAKRMQDGDVSRCVYAANPVEFVAYDADGKTLWKRSTKELAGAGPDGVGGVTSLRLSAANELITVTTGGWILKLDALNGRPVDAYRLRGRVRIGQRVFRGTFAAFKSSVVIGDTLYFVAEFIADNPDAVPPQFSPVYLFRVDLCRPDLRMSFDASRDVIYEDSGTGYIRVGFHQSGGSPPASIAADGTVLLFANARGFVRGRSSSLISAIEDRNGMLRVRWRSALSRYAGDRILAAPALHGPSSTLLVTTIRGVYIFRGVDSLEGDVPSPLPVSGRNLLRSTYGVAAARVQAGSPLTLTFDQDANELVGYTNFRVTPIFRRQAYGFLGAFALPIGRRGAPRPLWSRSLAFDDEGRLAPGDGTFGQPALFRFTSDAGEATGLIVNTVRTGTYIFK